MKAKLQQLARPLKEWSNSLVNYLSMLVKLGKLLSYWPRLEGLEYIPQPTRRIPMFGHRWGQH
eukprot:9633595-Prorocentrum_lima.AAC.1